MGGGKPGVMAHGTVLSTSISGKKQKDLYDLPQQGPGGCPAGKCGFVNDFIYTITNPFYFLMNKKIRKQNGRRKDDVTFYYDGYLLTLYHVTMKVH